VQQNVRSEKLQAERQVSDQAMQLTAKETELQTAAKAKKELEAKLSESEEMCAVWRAKARHRHRALEMPRFSNDKGGKQQKEQWLKDRALSETLGIDADNDKELTVTIDAPPPVGLGLLNAKDNSGQNFTVIHSIKEVSTQSIACVCRQLCAEPPHGPLALLPLLCRRARLPICFP
jgi:regulator of protease activity HflC (stomatin/prohibitin superfamily)